MAAATENCKFSVPNLYDFSNYNRFLESLYLDTSLILTFVNWNQVRLEDFPNVTKLLLAEWWLDSKFLESWSSSFLFYWYSTM